jgi:hypothetical protein
MIRWVRDFRLVPIVLFATISLFALKAVGLLIDGRYLLDDTSGRNAEDMDITGTIAPASGSAPAAKGGRPTSRPSGPQSWAQ